MLCWLLGGVCVSSAAPPRETCLLCGGNAAQSSLTVSYRGREYRVCRAAELARWEEAKAEGRLDALVQAVEPRSALFQADSRFLNPDYAAANPVGGGWLCAALLVLAALVSGSVGAAVAVSQHRPARAAFALCFLLPGGGPRRRPPRGNQGGARG
jgi:hypothetical protein